MRRANLSPSLSISQTFTLISVLAVIITLGCVAYTLVDMRAALVEQKRFEIRHSVEAAGTIIHSYVERAQKGEISEEDAKKAAVKALEKARFDDNNYFFIYTFDTLGIMHPNPKMVGDRFDTMTDAKGKFLIRELAAAAKAGGGFVDYYWAKTGESEPSPKISYAYAIPEWQWYVGAGLYIKDVDAAFVAIALRQAEVIAPVAAVFIGLIFFLSRRVSRLLSGLTREMKQLADGDLDAEIGEQGRGDEIGAMARAVQVFKDNSLALVQSRHDRLRMESETSAEREAREAEKAREDERLQFAILTLATGLEDLASGNLVQRLETPFPDQSEKLRVDFNASIERLQRTMLDITAGSQKILSGSGEISSASDNLARRTEQQAASLEETAAALDEITATVRQTAVRAEKAHNVVLAAKQDAGHSGEIVNQAVEAMGLIEKSSQQIGQIIGVIDEIAFQTNLLALNAGVEAARAGEAGRGFAVVASEVRGLAQRSAEAAKEIKTLISASTTQVEQGVNLVARTGTALSSIVTKITEITEIISEITSGAKEEAASLNEVNTAVIQLDKITQQNAAMVEEATAAAHDLAREASELTELVGQFQVADPSAPVRRIASARPRSAAPANHPERRALAS
jgi:methyl-accepting chemotaxis protein